VHTIHEEIDSFLTIFNYSLLNHTSFSFPRKALDHCLKVLYKAGRLNKEGPTHQVKDV